MHKLHLNALTFLMVLSPSVVHAGEPVISFHEETLSAGINSVYSGEWQYMVGGGAATFDCNRDGYPDLFLSGGSSPSKFYLNASTYKGPLKFKEQVSGLEIEQVTGAYPLDVDSDGNTDILVLRVGENLIMRGKGECQFERANEAWSFEGGDAWSVSASATWERGEKWPTIAIGNYIDRTQEMEPWGSCTDNWLHRPGSNGVNFAHPLPLKPSFCPLSILFTDWNRSGIASLRVSNDREYYEGGQEQLWRIEPNEAPVLYTGREGWKYLRIWGMGIASYDLDSDGYPEYFLTSMADHKLQTLANILKDGPPKPEYKDVAFSKGVTVHRPYTGGEWLPSTGWHAQFEDLNNDGLVDLFVAKGNVAEMPDFAKRDPNNLLVQLKNGKFQEVGDKAGVASLENSRGAALTDFNLDGRLDLIVVNRWVNAQLWRNTTRDAGHWIEVKFEQSGSNRDGIGSWVEIKCGDKVLSREVTVGGGHASGQVGWWHFGLGELDDLEIRVIWPDGKKDPWHPIAANAFYILEREKPPRLWQPQ